MTERKEMTRNKRHVLVIPAVPPVIPAVPLFNPALLFVIPAKAGIQVTGRTGWIPAPHFRGDEFTPAEAGAGMTGKIETQH